MRVVQALSEGRAGELLNRITDSYRQADAKLVRHVRDRPTEVWPHKTGEVLVTLVVEIWLWERGFLFTMAA